jgi:EAL domain-containing protein (putative c-di-GMP-specific phosphodiesterase class I)/response regulator of citrate/malate metabolism
MSPEPGNRTQDSVLDLLCRTLDQAADGGPIQGAAELLLQGMLQLTGSRYGCMGEVLPAADGAPDFRLHAAADSGDRPGMGRPEDNMALRHVDRLRAAVIRTGKTVSDDDPDLGERNGEPTADTFLGVPAHHGSALVGLIVLAGRPGGYGETAPDFLAPLARAYAALIGTTHLREERRHLAGRLTHAQALAERLAELGNRQRSHLNVILGHVQLFGLNSGLDEESRSQAREIEQAARALLALAEELPDLSRTDAKAIPRPDADGAMPEAPAAPSAPRGQRVLVVEDHPINQAVLRRLLETFGCTVDVAANGREALVQWQAGDYALILADLNMPGMNGFELVRAVRAREAAEGGRIPIVAVTAATVSEECAACQAAGMDGVLAKPIELDALRAVLRRWRIGQVPGSDPAPGVIEPERALIGVFISMARQDLTDVRRLLQGRDSQGLADITHRLKSSALSMGAVHFSRLATDLERSARNGRWLEAERLFGELEKALADFGTAPAETAPISAVDSGDEPISPEEMRQAILHDEFEVHFQPKVDAITLQPVGVEALARWRSGRHGWVSPEAFIALAERYGLIGPLSELLLTKALFGAARLNEAGFPLRVAVNLSASWLAQPQLPELVLATVRVAGIPAERVVLEIGEAGVGAVAPTSWDGLAQLRRHGLGFAIDGFNPAGRSPDWWRRMGFGKFKLDRAATARAELPSSLEQARALGIAIVAEGVETPGDLERARSLGCDLVQGHLIAAAMPIEDLIRWLRVRSENSGTIPAGFIDLSHALPRKP